MVSVWTHAPHSLLLIKRYSRRHDAACQDSPTLLGKASHSRLLEHSMTLLLDMLELAVVWLGDATQPRASRPGLLRLRVQL